MGDDRLKSALASLKLMEEGEDDRALPGDADFEPGHPGWRGSRRTKDGSMDWPKWTRPTKANLEIIDRLCSGKGGDFEAEAVLGWSKWEADRGYVTFTSRRGADISAVIRRCGSAIRRFSKLGDEVSFEINMKTIEGKNVFRGFQYAFAPIDIESKPLPKGAFKKTADDEEEED